MTHTAKSDKLELFIPKGRHTVTTASDYCDVASCFGISRLLNALRSYSSFKSEETQNERNYFIQFAKEVYTHSQAIDDFHHLQYQHARSNMQIYETKQE